MTAPVALVTASSAGLGAATAKGLAQSGFNIVINYNSNKQKADKVVEDILEQYHDRGVDPASSQHEKSVQCIAIQADMSRQAEIKRLISKAVTHFGRLDAVVSNQGWTQMRQFDDLDDNMEESDWDICYNMNVKSHLFLFHAARPHLAATRGSFVTIASLAGVIPSGSSIVCQPLQRQLISEVADQILIQPYAVTKAAQIHLVKSLAKVAAPDITVNSISPGILLTVSCVQSHGQSLRKKSSAVDHPV
jgi:NAD(P)-dependent dehydrogenase (short-subunit alcohol dehydrogenase family)